MTLVDVRGLVARRGRFDLEISEWQVPPGIVVGVVGPNGAGKTTLLEVIAGLGPRTSGDVQVLGEDPQRHPERVRLGLGFMSDDLGLFDLRVGALLRLLSGYYPTWDAALVDKLLGDFELDDRAKVSRLSKGQGTRLRLITAMAYRPKVLVLDEPATGLDVTGRRRLLRAVLDVVQDPERSVVVSSHQLGDVERIADRLLVLNAGRVVAEGPTPDLVGAERTLEEALLQWGAA